MPHTAWQRLVRLHHPSSYEGNCTATMPHSGPHTIDPLPKVRNALTMRLVQPQPFA